MVAKRTDHNQADIIQALWAIGATVQDLSQLGKGTPDLLCGYKGRNYLIEVKNCENRAPRLTDCEEKWIRSWKGQVGVITSIEDAIAILQDADLQATADKNNLITEGVRGQKSSDSGSAERAVSAARKKSPDKIYSKNEKYCP